VVDIKARTQRLEKAFLTRYPDYESVLADSVGAIRERLRSVSRIDDPFPHIWVEQLLPDRLYTMLVDAWPPDEYFWSDRPNRFDLVTKPPGTDPSDDRADRWERLPAPIRRVWDFFVIDVNRRLIGPCVQQLFASEIEERFALLRSADKDGAGIADYLRPPFRPQMNVGRLMMRGSGYRLKPHLDPLAYLVTALYYFPRGGDDVNELGTTLYRVESGLDAEQLLRRQKTEYFDRAGIEAREAGHIPFVGNALLAFANTPYSAHGMQVRTEGPLRCSFQSHLSLKGDSCHL
jgi:hypothetical protein